MAGIAWWTSDIGGFWGGDQESEEFRELLVDGSSLACSVQYAAFTVIAAPQEPCRKLWTADVRL